MKATVFWLSPRRWFALVLWLLAGLNLPAQNADPLTRERDEQTGTAITILFDNSGSMKKDNKIGQAKSAFRAWLQTVPPEYKLSLITFENNGRLTVPLGERTRDLISQRVAQLDANTSTPICGALRIAREQIEKRRREITPYERHVVLVFTDGQETADPRGNDGVRADILALRQKTVEVVGVGFHEEGDYMNGVATRFALANNEPELKRSLAKVDAEVGGADDLVVTEADLEALRVFDAPAVQPIAATVETGTAAEAIVEPASAATPVTGPPKKAIPFGWIFMAVIAWLVIRNFSSSKKKKR